MKVFTEELEACEVLLTVEVDARQEQRMLETAAKNIAKELRIPGFRPGKAPYNVVVRRFGLEAIQQEALEKSADKVIQDALEEADVKPYAQIGLESIKWNPLIIKLKIPTRPKVEIGTYRDIRLEFDAIEVTDEDINDRLEELQKEYAVWAPVDRPSEMADLITVSLLEKDGDRVLREDENVEYELDAPENHEGHNHPDWTTPLLGLSAGEEKIFTWNYPDSAENPDYAGKEITAEVKVISVKAKELDPLDDEFAMSISDFETLDALKSDIAEHLHEERQSNQDIELGQKVLDQIIEEATIIWPQAFEDESVEEEISRVERQMEAFGLTMDAYFQMQKTDKEAFASKTREDVVSQLKRSLVIGKIVELEKLTVNQSEILRQAKRIADYSGRGEQVWRNILASQTQQTMIASDLLTDKAVRFLAAVARGKDPVVEAEETTIDDEGVSSGIDDTSGTDDTLGTDDTTETNGAVADTMPQAETESQETMADDDGSDSEPLETETDN